MEGVLEEENHYFKEELYFGLSPWTSFSANVRALKSGCMEHLCSIALHGTTVQL